MTRAPGGKVGLLKKQLTFIGLAILVLGSTAASCQRVPSEQSAARVRAAGKLEVAVDPSYPPFASLDEKGRPIGFEIDLAGEVARRLGVLPDYVGMDVGGVMDALIARKVDVAISGMPPAPEYGKQLAYSRPYFNAGQVIVTLSDGLEGTDALAGRTVGVESGSTGDIEMRKLLAQVRGLSLKSYTTPDVALADLRLGKLEAVVTDGVTALEFARQYPDANVSAPFVNEYYVVALRKADVSLRDEINRMLDDLERDGYLRALEEKWLR